MGLDGPSIPVRVEPVQVPEPARETTPEPERETAPATTPKEEPVPV
jgi:hypothetical protein